MEGGLDRAISISAFPNLVGLISELTSKITVKLETSECKPEGQLLHLKEDDCPQN